MPFPSALTTNQQTLIRAGYYNPKRYVALWENAIVFRALVNQSSFDTTFASVDFDTVTTGSLAAAKEGYTVYIGTGTDLNDASFVGRVRPGSSGSTLNINQTSAALSDNMTITVIKDTRLWEKLWIDDNGTYKMDWDITYRSPLPVIGGLPSTIVIKRDSNGNADTDLLAPTGIAGTSGATISTWSWSVDGASFVTGNASSQNVTLRWTSAGQRMVRVTVTDSGSRSNYFDIKVYVLNSDLTGGGVITGLDTITITNDIESGFNASIPAFEGVEDVLDYTACVIFTEEDYNGNTTPIVSNVNFAGRLRNEQDQADGDENATRIETAQYQLEGALTELGRLRISQVAATDTASPSQFGEINDLTPWRMIILLATEFSTLSNLHSLTFFSTDNTYQFPELGTSSNSAADSINDIAFRVNAAMCFAADGQLSIQRSALYLSSSDRNALTTVADLTLDDLFNYSVQRDFAQTVGKVEGYGASYNTASGDLTVIRAVAPAVASGTGQGQGQFDKQILTADAALDSAQSELAQRVANELAAKNPTDIFSGTLLDGYHWMVASTFQWYTLTFTSSVTGKTYTTANRWLLTSVEQAYDAASGIGSDNAILSVSVQFSLETASLDAQVLTELAPGEADVITNIIPGGEVFPTFPANPGELIGSDDPASDDVPNDDPVPDPTAPLEPPEDGESPEARQGNVVACKNSAGVWITTNFCKTDMPTWRDVRPTASGITDFARQSSGNGMYVLSNNGTNTTLWYTSNIFKVQPVWTGTTISGVYTQIATTNIKGQVYVIDPQDSNVWCETFNFTVSDGGWTVQASRGVYSAGVGFVANTVSSSEANQIQIALSFATTAITKVTVTYNFTQGQVVSEPNADTYVRTLLSGSEVERQEKNSATGSGQTVTLNASGGGVDEIDLRIRSSYDLGSPPPSPLGSVTITSIEVCGTGTNPFGSSSNILTRYSTNNGSTFASNVIAGGSPSAVATGVGTQRVGPSIYVGASGNVIRKASAGGSYADDADAGSFSGYAVAILGYGEDSNEYLFATDAFQLFDVSGGSATDITPNDGANDALPQGPYALSMAKNSDTHIWYVAKFGSVHKLAYTADGGSNWSFTSGLTTNAKMVKVRPGDPDRKQVYIPDNASILYSPDGGATLVSKTAPSTSIDKVEVWG